MYSSTGATLSGSYTGATAEPTAAGFKWGTNPSNLNNTASSSVSGTSGDLTATLSNLSAGTTYYYKAFVTVSGTGDYASQSQTFYGTQYSFTTKKVATATVTTSAATSVSSSGATLNGSFSGASGTISDRGFKYKATSDANWQTVGLNSTTGTSGSFSATIGSLSPNTEYMFLAYVTELNESTNTYEDRWDTGSAKTFTTSGQSSAPVISGWLELPAATSGSDYYNGVFKDGSARNYSYLYQKSTYTSLWTAYPLYASTMGDGYSASWKKNDALTEAEQVNCWSASYNVIYGETNYVNNASSASEYYSRGHNIPNADRSGNNTMQSQTFVATNSTPQIQNKFNAKIWSTLEGDVRGLVSGTDTVYVVTGAAFHKIGGSTESITYIHPKGDPDKSVPVPNYYWKVLLKVQWSGSGSNKTVTSAKAIGVWIPHQQYNSSDYSSFVTSVDQIEEWTGFNFFHNLPANVEQSAESISSWNTFKSSSWPNISSVSGNNWGSF